MGCCHHKCVALAANGCAVWAPTAQQVQLLHWPAGPRGGGGGEAEEVLDMQPGARMLRGAGRECG